MTKIFKVQGKNRFIGIRPFEENEKDIFFERAEITEQIVNSLKSNKITLIHSSAGVGKTSIIKAGVLPILHKNVNSKVIYISFSNFIKNAGINPLNQIYAEIEDFLPINSYLDRLIEPENSLWYKLKRIENAQDEPIYLILDQFENIFTHEQSYTYQLRTELFSAIYEPIPKNLKKIIEQKLQEDPNILTDKGFEKLFNPVNLHVLFSIRTDKLEKLNFFADKIKILENIIEIKPFDAIQAKNILLKTANFIPKYNIDNLYSSKPFILSENLISRIQNFLTRDNLNAVETYQIQIIGKKLEQIAIENNLSVISTEHVGRIEEIFEDYYDSIVKKIPDSQQQTAARKFIEDELIFEYEHRKLTIYQGVAAKKYGLTNTTINYLVANHLITPISEKNGEIFYEISHDALITPILVAKQKRIKYEITIQEQLREKERLEQQNKIQREKIKITRKFAYFLAIALIFAVIFAILAINKSNLADKNKRIALSNLYVAHSFNNFKTDGTLSFRLAQNAYKIDKTNPLAISCLLNSFYNAKYFYSVVDTIDFNFQQAFICDSTEQIAFIDNSQHEKQVLIFNPNNKTTQNIKFEKTICFYAFLDSNRYALSTTIDGKTTIFNQNNTSINEFSHNTPINFVNISQDKKLIVTCGLDNEAKIWNLKGQLLRTLKHNTGIVHATFSQNNELIATTTNKNEIIIWNNNSQIVKKHTYELEFDKQWVNLTVCNFSPDSKYILFAVNSYTSKSYQIKVWDWENDKIIAQFKDLDNWINNAFFIDSLNIIAYSKNGTLYSFNINNNNKYTHYGHSSEIVAASFHTQKSTLITVSRDKTIRKWRIYKPFQFLENYTNISHVKFSNSGNLIALSNRQLIVTDLLGKIKYLTDLNFEPYRMEFNYDDSYVVANNQNYFLWSNVVTKAKTSLKIYDSIIYVGIAGDNSKIIVSTPDNVYSYNFRGQRTNVFVLKKKSTSFAIIYNKIIATNKNNVLIYTLDGKLLDSIDLPNIKQIYASKADNYQILLVANTKFYLLDKNHKHIFETDIEKEIKFAKISQNGDFIAIATEDECYLYNNLGQKIITFPNLYKINDLDFTSNQKYLFVLSKISDNQSILHSFIISPDEINKYVDDLKLFGEVQVFDDKYISKVFKNEM